MSLVLMDRWPGIPVPEIMTKPHLNMIQYLQDSTPHITPSVARLWAKASNSALESAITRILRGAGLTHRSEPAVLQGMNDVQKRESLLTEIMGIVFPGDTPFKAENGYVVFPANSKDFDSKKRHHPFGILVIQDVVHLFVDKNTLRFAAEGINRFLLAYTEVHPRFLFFVHITHRSVLPKCHEDIKNTWPLIVYPSLFAYWHDQEIRVERGEPADRYLSGVKFFILGSNRLDKILSFPKYRNWHAWIKICQDVAKVLSSLQENDGVCPKERLDGVPEAVAKARIRLPSVPFHHHTAAHYADLTGVKTYGKRGRGKPMTLSELGAPLQGSQFYLAGDLDTFRDYPVPGHQLVVEVTPSEITQLRNFRPGFGASEVFFGVASDDPKAESIEVSGEFGKDTNMGVLHPAVQEALERQTFGPRPKGKSRS